MKSLLPLYLAMCLFCPALFFLTGCGQGPEKIITKTDTLATHDTLNRTIHDTAKIPIGKIPPYLLFGVLIDGLPENDSTFIGDSMYAYLSISSNRAMKNAVVSCNGHPLAYTVNQQMRSFFDGYNNSVQLFPGLASSQYESFFKEAAKALPWSVRLPYYTSDSSPVLLFDSLADSATFPLAIDSLTFFDMSGKRYDSIDYFNYTSPRSIKLGEDLTIRWKNGKAPWYAVECRKYSEQQYTYKAIGDPLDTAAADSQMVIPNKYFYQDSLSDSLHSYDFLYITVLPVSGPAPVTWDTCSSFGKKGFLFAMHYNNPFTPVSAAPAQALHKALAKRSAARPGISVPIGEIFSKIISSGK